MVRLKTATNQVDFYYLLLLGLERNFMTLKFGDAFPTTFFSGSSTMKKEFISASDFSGAISEGRAKVDALVLGASLSLEGAAFVRACFEVAPLEFFYMPTSSTGKYHGGQADPCNCVGGNIVHTEQVLAMADKVLHRYEDALGVFYEQLSEALRVSCLLHDIAKYAPGDLFVSKTHGESGAELIRSVVSNYDWSELVCLVVKSFINLMFVICSYSSYKESMNISQTLSL